MVYTPLLSPKQEKLFAGRVTTSLVTDGGLRIPACPRSSPEG